MLNSSLPRRDFLKALSGAMAIPLLPTFTGCSAIERRKVVLTSEGYHRKFKDNGDKRLGIALVGLGSYTKGQLVPALELTDNVYLAALVSGDRDKANSLGAKYNIPSKNLYTYDTFHQIADNEEVDIVYVVLPNALHAEYTIRAAEAGKHVICEKPMAITEEECRSMIAACDKAGRMLSVGYRLHFEPYNQEMMRLGQKMEFGAIKTIKSGHGMSSTSGWRLDRALAGGGPLMDVGIYVVQAAIYTTGEVPLSVLANARTDHPKQFKNIEETLYWTMKFPSGATAVCETSYSHESNYLRVEAEDGWFELSPAFKYGGLAGRTSRGEMKFPDIYQQAAQMDDFGLCITEGRESRVPGEMGLRDVRILRKIYEAMESGREITL